MTKIVDHYDDNHLLAPTGQAISWEGEAELIAFNSWEHAASSPAPRTSTH